MPCLLAVRDRALRSLLIWLVLGWGVRGVPWETPPGGEGSRAVTWAGPEQFVRAGVPLPHNPPFAIYRHDLRHALNLLH